MTAEHYEYTFAAWLPLNLKKLSQSCHVGHLWFAADGRRSVCTPYQSTSPSWIISLLCCPLTLFISFFPVLPTVLVQAIHSVWSLFPFLSLISSLSVLYSQGTFFKLSIIFVRHLLIVGTVHESIILLVSPWKQNRKCFDAVKCSLCESETCWERESLLPLFTDGLSGEFINCCYLWQGS